MISFISKRIALFLFDNGIVDEEKKQICQYGFEIIISTAVGFLLVAITGAVMNSFGKAMLFYILFVGVRMFTGGYHADTHLKCKLILFLCSLSVISVSEYISEINSLYMNIAFLIPYWITVLLFVPVAHTDTVLTECEKKRNKIISVVMAVALSAMILMGYRKVPEFSFVSSLTMFVVAVLIIISKINERRNKNEQVNRENS